MKKALFVYNPYSGGHNVPQQLDSILRRGLEFNTLIQPYRTGENNENLPEVLTSNDYDLVIISGGDGTLNTIINLLLKNNLHLPVGIIPSGTCNDFARSLNLPASLSKSLDIVFTGSIIDIDLGLINGERYFLNTCGGGLFIDASFNTDNELKRNFGPFAYYLKALSEVTHKRPFSLKIKTETEKTEENVLLFFILNGTQGGGFSNLICDASMSDGIVDIVLVKNCAHIELANLFFRVLAHESINDKYVRRIKARDFVIEGDSNVYVSVDGEKGSTLPISVKVIHRALKVFVS